MARSLSDEQAVVILRDLESGMTVNAVAARHCTTRHIVRNIATGRTHRNVLERWEADHDGTTEAELDALIEERRKDMPKEPRVPRKEQLPHVVLRGLGIRASGLNQRRQVAP